MSIPLFSHLCLIAVIAAERVSSLLKPTTSQSTVKQKAKQKITCFVEQKTCGGLVITTKTQGGGCGRDPPLVGAFLNPSPERQSGQQN